MECGGLSRRCGIAWPQPRGVGFVPPSGRWMGVARVPRPGACPGL